MEFKEVVAFYIHCMIKYILVKIKTRENVSSVLTLITAMGDLVTQDSERAKVLNAFFASVFASSFQVS